MRGCEHRRALGAVLLTIVLVMAGCGSDDDGDGAGAGGADSGSGPATLEVTAAEFSFQLPESVPAGATRISVSNEGAEPHHAQLFKLNDGATMEDLGQKLAGGDIAALLEVGIFAGGTGTVDPGGTSSAEAVPVLEEGQYAFMCFVDGADGLPHVAKGMLTGFAVSATEDAPAAVDTLDTIDLLDYAFNLPGAELEGGVYTVANKGEEPHEMNVVRLADGATQDDVVAFFAGEAQGPPKFSGVGGVQALLPGPTGSQAVDLDLAPGRYTFLCLIPSVVDGQPHYQKGMITTVDLS